MRILHFIFKDRSLWYKLALPSVLPVIFVIVIVSVMLAGSFESAMMKEAENRADALVDLTRISMSNSFVVYNKKLLDTFVDGLGNMDNVRYAFVVDTSDNRILAHNVHAMDGRLATELPEDMQFILKAGDLNTPLKNSGRDDLLYIQSAPVIINRLSLNFLREN